MPTTVALGPFAFDRAAGRRIRDGASVPLGGQALAVLTALGANEGTMALSEESHRDAAFRPPSL